MLKGIPKILSPELLMVLSDPAGVPAGYICGASGEPDGSNARR